MSGPRGLWTDGQAVTTPDMQRMADAGAGADDLSLEKLLPPWVAQKRVVPLIEQTNVINPRTLIVGSAGGAANGHVRLQPALFLAGGLGQPYQMALSAMQAAAVDGPLHGNNSSGLTRYDLLYATIQRNVTIASQRKIKDPTTGVESTQTLNLQSDAQVTLGIVSGVSQTTPLASLPADTSTAWNFGLATVALANGYAGGAIAQSAIAPWWTGGGVPIQRRRTARPAAIFATSDTHKTTSRLLLDRFGFGEALWVGFRVPTDTQTNFVLDDTIDWRSRVVRIHGALPPAQAGTYVAPELLTNGAGPVTDEVGPSLMFFGSSDVNSTQFVPRSNPANKYYLTFGTASGALVCSIQAHGGGGVYDAVNGDNWWFFIEATDQFKDL